MSAGERPTVGEARERARAQRALAREAREQARHAVFVADQREAASLERLARAKARETLAQLGLDRSEGARELEAFLTPVYVDILLAARERRRDRS